MTSKSSPSDVPQNLYIQRIAPEYDADCLEVSIAFETESAFDLWFEKTARRHAHWITRQTNISKRNAAITAEMSEEAANICLLPKMVRYFICDHGRSKSYVWQHANHNPLDKSDIASSRLPKAIKDLVRQQADSNKN
ncbi:hypothetical protein EDC94DRAFT_522292 [Helicostylum pulchrum]|nr:hypothetical protein EDC94DRAFT_522292 [Helicostylum pulchrum]